jgi:hypothetical protein
MINFKILFVHLSPLFKGGIGIRIRFFIWELRVFSSFNFRQYNLQITFLIPHAEIQIW